MFHLFYEAMIILTLKLKKDSTRKKLQTIILHEHTYKILNKILAD